MGTRKEACAVGPLRYIGCHTFGSGGHRPGKPQAKVGREAVKVYLTLFMALQALGALREGPARRVGSAQKVKLMGRSGGFQPSIRSSVLTEEV
jgi:hypothetical protein